MIYQELKKEAEKYLRLLAFEHPISKQYNNLLDKEKEIQNSQT